MAVELVITFEGDAPGLRLHALSINQFAACLKPLLAAVRDTAYRMAGGDPAVSRRAARSRRQLARQLDLLLPRIEDNCVTLPFQLADLNPAGSEQHDEAFARSVVFSFVNDLTDAARGAARHQKIAKYLAALPRNVTQHYQGRQNGQAFANFRLNPTAEQPKAFPGLLMVQGRIEALRLHTGSERVGLRDANNRKFVCAATAAQVDLAYDLRHDDVEALLVESAAGRRLLRLSKRETYSAPDAEERSQRILVDWEHTLRRLAE